MSTQAAETNRRRRRRWPWLVGALLLFILLPFVALAWLLATEAGLRTAIGAVERFSDGQVRVENAAGRFAGPMHVGRIRVDMPTLKLDVADLTLEWAPVALLDRSLQVARLAIGSIDLSREPGAEGAPAPALPHAIVLPGMVAIHHVVLGRFTLHDWGEAWPTAAEPVFEIKDLSLSMASDGRLHRIQGLEVSLPFGVATLAAEFDSANSPYVFSAQGTLSGSYEGRDFVVQFEGDGDVMEPRVRMRAEGAGLSGQAEIVVAPFEAVPLRHLTMRLGEIDPAAFHAAAPQAALTVTAELIAESADEWILVGPVRIENRLPDTVDNSGIPFSSVDARVRWSATATDVDALTIVLPDEGRITGAMGWRPDASGDSMGRASAMLQLAGIRVDRIDSRLPEATVSGRIDADGDETQQSASVDLAIDAARVEAQGELRFAGGEDGSPVFDVTGAVASFNPAALHADAPQADLNLDFAADGTLADTPSLRLSWEFHPSTVEGRPLGGKGRIELDGEHLVDGDILIDVAGNLVSARGAWGRPGDAVAFEIDAGNLGALGYELAGRARADGTVSGSRTEPAGEIRLFAEALVLPDNVRVDGLNATGRLDAGLDGPISFALGMSGIGKVGEAAWLDNLSLAVSGRRDAHEIDIALLTPDADTLEVRLSGALLEGSTAPGAQAFDGARWRGTVDDLRSTGRLPLRLSETAELTVSRERVSLASARLDAGENGRIQLDEAMWSPELIRVRGGLTGLEVDLAERGEGELRRPRRGPGVLTLGATWDVSLGETANGEVRLFRESGDIRIPGELAARVGLEQLEAQLNLVANRLALAVNARGTEMGVVTGSLTALVERSDGGAWGLAPDAAMLGSARMEMASIAWLARLVQEELVLGGSLSADFSFSGTPADPLAVGRITGREISILMVDHGLQLSGGELLAEFDRDRLRLTSLEFVSPNRVRPRDPRVPVDALTVTPGRLSASGDIALDSGLGAFSFTADRLPILQRTDRWLIMSGEGTANSTWTSLDLSAKFRADAGYVELADAPPPTLSGDVVILGREEPLREGGLKVSADVLVSLGDQLYLSGLGLDTRLTGELRIRLRDGEPLSAVGTIATAGGIFRGYGQNLTLERGLINFQGALDNPGLNVVALRKGLPVEAGISVLGSVRRPLIRLVSEPNVPDPEKLSWIALGRAPAAGAGADLGLLLPAAQALLGGSEGGMTDQLSRSLGFDQFAIGQGELGSVSRTPTSRVVGSGTTVYDEGTVSGQVLMLGKRLSTDLFLSFEQSLGGAENLVKLSYQLSRRVSIVARGGSDNSADIYYTVSFR